MGGDLFALVHVDGRGDLALNASGRAGSGADAAAMRAAGLTDMPFRLDIRSVTVPGCVDGWIALHERYGSLPLDVLFAPARRLADRRVSVQPAARRSLADRLDPVSRINLTELANQATRTGALVRRPGVGEALADIAADGRDAFYGGPFGDGLIDLGAGLFTDDDLGDVAGRLGRRRSARRAFGVDAAHDRSELAGLPHARRQPVSPNTSTSPTIPTTSGGRTC